MEVNASDQRDVLIIPATSVVYAPYGDTVFVLAPPQNAPRGELKNDDRLQDRAPPTFEAQPRFVRLGERRGDLVAVESGLTAGETVVSNGAFKLRKGARVVLNDDLAPPVELDPRPTDK